MHVFNISVEFVNSWGMAWKRAVPLHFLKVLNEGWDTEAVYSLPEA
jgi:hypothetical protein